MMPGLWGMNVRDPHPAGFVLGIATVEKAESVYAAEAHNSALLVIIGALLLVIALYHFYLYALTPALKEAFHYAVFAISAAALSQFWFAFDQRTPLEMLVPAYAIVWFLLYLTLYSGLLLLFKFFRMRGSWIPLAALAVSTLLIPLSLLTATDLAVGGIFLSSLLFIACLGYAIYHRLHGAHLLAAGFIGLTFGPAYLLIGPPVSQTYAFTMEALLKKRTRALVRAERESAFSQFVQGIVHNLRSPLTAITGGVDLNENIVNELLEAVRTGEIDRGRFSDELRELLDAIAAERSAAGSRTNSATVFSSRSSRPRSVPPARTAPAPRAGPGSGSGCAGRRWKRTADGSSWNRSRAREPLSACCSRGR
ncbi:MAG: hypothetical protein MAG453_01854 [Calditrichaeota bacterium]|nr:hypothetical protein [Calditrichota bacterium]